MSDDVFLDLMMVLFCMVYVYVLFDIRNLIGIWYLIVVFEKWM